MPIVVWLAILVWIAILIRLVVTVQRYRALRAAGREVRWESPAVRWWRRATGSSKVSEDEA